MAPFYSSQVGKFPVRMSFKNIKRGELDPGIRKAVERLEACKPSRFARPGPGIRWSRQLWRRLGCEPFRVELEKPSENLLVGDVCGPAIRRYNRLIESTMRFL